MALTASDLAALRTSVKFWEIFEYSATAIVFLGVVGEYVAEFTKWATNRGIEKKLAKISTLVLIMGIAGEGLGLVRTSQRSGELIAALESNFVAYVTGQQPTCDSAPNHRGALWNVFGGTGVADIVQSCLKNAADTYAWVTLSSGGAVARPSIITASFPDAMQSQAYSQCGVASGGATPYTWSIGSGSLPSPLTLNASTGCISGTPRGTGSSTFTLVVADNNQQAAAKSLTIRVRRSTGQ